MLNSKTQAKQRKLKNLDSPSKSSDESVYVDCFQILEMIGFGGYASVYKAINTVTEEVVAAKIINLKNLTDRQRFKIKREIKIHSELKHPSIARIYKVVEQSDRIYIFMEYAQKGQLFQYIKQNGPLPQHLAFKLFSQIHSATQYLHHQDIVHRDIKTENVVLDQKMNAKLIDFGLAKRITRGRVIMGRTETICGSPSYYAPQVVEKKCDYNGKEVDVWCLGVTLYTMIQGYLPFDERNPDKLNTNIINLKYHEPQNCSPQCKQLLAQIFQPAERRPTCYDISQSNFFKKHQAKLPKLNKPRIKHIKSEEKHHVGGSSMKLPQKKSKSMKKEGGQSSFEPNFRIRTRLDMTPKSKLIQDLLIEKMGRTKKSMFPKSSKTAKKIYLTLQSENQVFI